MRKHLLVCLAAVLGTLSFLHAQNFNARGKVSDEKRAPLSDVSVIVKGTRRGTLTKRDGSFSIAANQGDSLEFSTVGYNTQTMEASTEPMNVELTLENKSLGEIVVTAMGIPRQKKALGYAVSTVASKDIALRTEGDVGRVLNGKVPGLDILNSSGISGSGTNITIRGVSTITGGASTPLYIVDGVPFDGGNNAGTNFQYGGGTSTSSRFLDLDPNNIESVSVLKGLAATTLYGEVARNGVILITTKNGSSTKAAHKKEVTVSQSLFANNVSNIPDYQDTYGGGFDLAPSAAYSNWGAKFTNPPLRRPYSPSVQAAYPDLYTVNDSFDYKPYDNVKAFFNTGLVSTTSLNISGASDKVSFNGSYSYMDDEGFTPGNRVYKNNFGLGGTAKLTNKLTLNAVSNFAITDFATPAVGANSGGGGPDVTSVFGFLIFTPRTVDLMGLPYENPLTHESIYYRNGNDIENPRWTAANTKNTDKVYRTYGTIGLRYDIMKGLNLNYRFGYDVYSEQTSLQVNKNGKAGGPQYVNGLYRTTSIFNSILNHNIIVSYSGRFAKDFTIEATAGADIRHDNYNQDGLKSNYQTVFGLFSHSNFTSHDILDESNDPLNPLQSKTEEIRTGVFAQGTVGYKEYVYLTLNGRNDWVSTLEKEHRRILYPGISLSFIPTSAIEGLKTSKAINYLKLRVGYSTSAHFPEPYKTRSSLNITTNAFVDNSGNSITVGSLPNRLPNPNLKPELLQEVEAGIEGRFFDSRVTLDLTGYFRTSKDQILDRQLDPSTGSTVTQINAGNVDNKGIEASIGITPVRSRDWTWTLTANYTLNRSKVHGLPDDIKQINIGGYSNLGTFAIEGKPLGVIQGTYTQVDSKSGKYIVDDNGYYLSSSDFAIIGDPNPHYKLTGISELSYKGITFRMQWDYTQGGQMWSNTVRTMLARGLTKDTEFDRALPFSLPNTVKQDGSENDYQQSVNNIYFNAYGFGPSSIAVYDATVIRLRELSLSYSLPADWLKKTPLGSVALVFTGTNLFYYAPNFPKYVRFDPESNSLGVSNSKGLDFFAGPSSRRLGGSIRITF